MVFGIDPGFSGAVAMYDGNDFTVLDMPVVPGSTGKTELAMRPLYDIFRTADCGQGVAWIERVSSRPKQGISSAFRFGEQFGALQMAVAARGLQSRFVTPAVWKSYFGLSSDKGVARGYAMKRFPALADQLARVRDDGRAEALLIALYGLEHTK